MADPMADDVFRNKVRWILEGMIEGATREETKDALYKFAMAHAHHDPNRWDKQPRDPDLDRRTHKATQPESDPHA